MTQFSYKLSYTLTLASDAEPGTGQGGEAINSLITRDQREHPVVRGSHIKGLMRDRLTAIADHLDISAEQRQALVDACFGRPGEAGDDGAESRVRVVDASIDSELKTLQITRTALNDVGTVGTSTLRTSEAIPVGTVFSGHLHIEDAEAGGIVDVATRLALVAIEAIGGNRRRGAGQCVVQLDKSQKPGELLRQLRQLIRTHDIPEPRTIVAREPVRPLSDAAVTWLRLTFLAKTPVCCPETPDVSMNVLQSGFAIPASAVQGAVLHRLRRIDDALASTCFGHDNFRAWPLLPSVRLDGDKPPAASVRVSLSHHMTKLPVDAGSHVFLDSILSEQEEWERVSRLSPLKAEDGVLLAGSGGVHLWRSKDMPRQISAHGVHYPERNLFTVEALAPDTWTGLLALPAEAAKHLCDSLAKDDAVVFGKARSIRGSGTLTAHPVDPGAEFAAAQSLNGYRDRLFIVQSPLAIPDDADIASESADAVLANLVVAAGWCRSADGIHIENTLATIGLRFGWNRHGQGNRVGQHNRLRARRVILPGSVVVLKQALSDIPVRLLRGVGGGREAGFGALLPHPGIAKDVHRDKPSLEPLKSDGAAREGLMLWRATKGIGPSPSQIGAVLGRLQRDRSECLDYLRRQEERPERVWRRWKNVAAKTRALIQGQPDVAVKALRVWQDLAVANREENR